MNCCSLIRIILLDFKNKKKRVALFNCIENACPFRGTWISPHMSLKDFLIRSYYTCDNGFQVWQL